ncbi:WD40-repeat-containing domain protein [Entophlyctis helioformis]|nr:WD40-repeat-containing domain protein [Entophlyctis helioformis]
MSGPFTLVHKVAGDPSDYPLETVASTQTPSHLAVSRAKGSIAIHDLTTFAVASVLSSPPGHNARILSQVLFDNSNPNLLFAGDRAGTVVLWDVRSRTSALTWNSYAPVLSFDVNCNHSLLAVGTELVGEDAKINFWDIRNAGGPQVASFIECHSDDVTQIKFHPTHAEAMISGSTDGLVCLYNLATFEEDDALYQVIKDDSVSKLGFFGPASEYLYATTHMETFSLWTFEEANKIYTFGDVRGVSPDLKLDYLVDCVYESAGQRLYAVAGSQEGSIGLLDVNLGQLSLAYTLNGGHTDIVRAAYWNTQAGMLVSGAEDGALCVWQQQQQQ